jgi:hypothetical protein
VLLLHKGIFPGELDSDVWVAYLHYYKEVSANGGIWPNDLWCHFYVSKGAGLFFMASLLTDVMSTPIVSWCFVIITAIIVYDNLSKHISDFLWPLLGALLVLLSLSAITNQYVIENTTSSFFKHHIVLMAFIAFAFWCGIRFTHNLSNETAWLLGISGSLSFFYIGIYISTTVIPIIAIWFFEVAIISFLYKKASQTLILTGFALAVLFGALMGFFINYSITGLADITPPLGLMWKFADKERFEKFWSPWIVEYYYLALSFDSSPVILSNILRVDINWVAQLCRTWFFKAVPLLSILIVLTALVGAIFSMNSWRHGIYNRKHYIYILYTVLFIGNALLFAQFFKNHSSLFRLYNFAVIFVILVVIMFWAAVLGPMSRRKPAIVAVIILLSAGFFIKDLPLHITKDRIEVLWQYIAGKISTKDAVADTDSLIYSYIKNDTGLSHFIEANRHIKGGGKMLYMGQDCGPGYFFPNMVLSEPSYALGDMYHLALFGSPEEARSAYQKLGINYFALNLRRQFFVGLPFSPLFNPENVQRYLDLIWSDGDFYLLTWRTENSNRKVPLEFLRKLEQRLFEESKTGWGKYYSEMYKKYNLRVHEN